MPDKSNQYEASGPPCPVCPDERTPQHDKKNTFSDVFIPSDAKTDGTDADKDGDKAKG